MSGSNFQSFSVLLIALAFVSGCVGSGYTEIELAESPLLGAWGLVDYSEDVKPCEPGASISFLPTGEVRAYSGEQVVEGRYTIKKYQSGYLVSQSISGHNGKPNCQGFSADFVVKNSGGEFYIEIDGDEAQMYPSKDNRTQFVRIARVKSNK